MNEIKTVHDALSKGNMLSYKDNHFKEVGKLEYFGRSMKQLLFSKMTGKDYLADCKMETVAKGIESLVKSQCNHEGIKSLEEVKLLRNLNKKIISLEDKISTSNKKEKTKLKEKIENSWFKFTENVYTDKKTELKSKKSISEALNEAIDTLQPIVSSYKELKKIKKECRAISQHLKLNANGNEATTFSMFIDRGNIKNIVSDSIVL